MPREENELLVFTHSFVLSNETPSLLSIDSRTSVTDRSRPPLAPGRRASPQGGAAGREGNARGGDLFGRGGPGGRAIDDAPAGGSSNETDWEHVENDKKDDASGWEHVEKDDKDDGNGWDVMWDVYWGQRAENNPQPRTEATVLGLVVYMKYEADESFKNSDGKEWLEQWIKTNYPGASSVVKFPVALDSCEKEAYGATTQALKYNWPSRPVSSHKREELRSKLQLWVGELDQKAQKVGSPLQPYAMGLGHKILEDAKEALPQET